MLYYGGVRKLLAASAPNLRLWDHGYGSKRAGPLGLKAMLKPYTYNLRNGDGELLNLDFEIPNDNTDPDGLAEIFSQQKTQPPKNTISRLLEFDVIIFKSCFPVTAIQTETQLEQYKRSYIEIRETIDQNPDRLFIPMTPPPLRATRTTSDQADRARRFASWIMSQEFCGGRKNMIPFDFFSELASLGTAKMPNVLRPEYCMTFPFDSHPNKIAHTTIAPKWTRFVVTVTNAFYER